MALFGTSRGPSFAGPYDTPPYAPPIAAMGAVEEAMQQNAATPRKHGFFGRGGAGRGIAGHLGDALMQMGGLQPIYGPAMQMQQKQGYEEAQYQRRLQDEMALWQQKEDYKRANPDPVNNDTMADYQMILNLQGKEAADAFLRNKWDPVITVNEAGPGGSVLTKYLPRSAILGGGAAAGPPPVLDEPPPGAIPLGQQGGAGQPGPHRFR